MPQKTLLSLCAGAHGSGGALFCVSWDTVRKWHSSGRPREKAWAGLVTAWGTSSVPLTRTSLPIHVCMGFAREDTVLVGDCIQRLGDVQEGVAAVNNPCHFLCTGSKFVVYQLREWFPQLVLITWKQIQRRDWVEDMWVGSQRALFVLV